MIGMGFAAKAIVTILVTRVARRALQEATGGASGNGPR